MKDIQALARREMIKAQGGKKLQRIGGSLAILIPKMWATANAVLIDGDYYIKVVNMDFTTIQLEPLDKEEIEAMLKGAK